MSAVVGTQDEISPLELFETRDNHPCLGDLAVARVPWSPSRSCADIDEWFRSDTGRRSLVVGTPGDVLLVNRSAFYEALAGRLGYGWSLFHDAPLSKLLGRVVPGLSLPAATPLRDAGILLLSGGQVDSDQDLLVVHDDGRVGTLAVRIVLSELVRVHADQVSRLAVSERRFRSLVENSFDGLILLDAGGRIIGVGPSSERTSGTRAAETVGTSVFDRVHPKDVGALRALLDAAVARPSTDLGGQFRHRGPEGAWGWVEVRARNLLADPAVAGIVVNYRDVTKAKRLEEQLRHDALHDSLTGLPNRAYIAEHGMAHLEAPKARACGVLFVDLDAFKDVNDTLGHAAGDDLLRRVAGRLSSTVQEADVVGRLGGDEFVVLVAGDHSPEEVASRILEALAEPFNLWGRTCSVTASVGIALHHGSEISDLLQRADIALYEAKRRGGNRAVVFVPEMAARLEGRVAIEAALSTALASEQFRLLYQPVFDLATRRPTGMEALLRWAHPERGVVSPSVFIPILESTGMIIDVGRWVLNEACRQAASWEARGAPVDVSVNLSTRQLEAERLVEDAADALAVSGVDPGRIVLEITESALIRDVDAACARLTALRALGLRFAIDDFGTGYSSLSYLRRLDVDVLKIDRSFVASLGETPRSVSLVRGLLQLTRDLGLMSVAEGVEEPMQLELLRELGCDKVQGFLLGRPLPAADATALLAGRVTEANGERRFSDELPERPERPDGRSLRLGAPATGGCPDGSGRRPAGGYRSASST